MDSANSRVDFTLTSNTNGTHGAAAQEAKEEGEDVYKAQNVLDQSRMASDQFAVGSRNMTSLNSKKVGSSVNEKGQTSQSTSKNAKAEIEGSEDFLLRAECDSKARPGQNQITHGTQSRSSVRGHE